MNSLYRFDPLEQIIRLLRPRAVFSKGISGAGDWAVRYPAFHHPGFCAMTLGTCLLAAKATGCVIVDGVYNADPRKDSTATKFDHIEYIDVLSRRLEVMDSTALSLCMENDLPIRVFDVFQPGAIRRILEGAEIGTLVSGASSAAPVNN